jgi:hypothetical protein
MQIFSLPISEMFLNNESLNPSMELLASLVRSRLRLTHHNEKFAHLMTSQLQKSMMTKPDFRDVGGLEATIGSERFCCSEITAVPHNHM